jgi:hypothetical protein
VIYLGRDDSFFIKLAPKAPTDHIFFKAPISACCWFDGLYFFEHALGFTQDKSEVSADKYFHNETSSRCEEFISDFQDFETEHGTMVLIVIISSCRPWSDIGGDELKSSSLIDSPDCLSLSF